MRGTITAVVKVDAGVLFCKTVYCDIACLGHPAIDATSKFEAIGHSSEARELRETFQIGIVAGKVGHQPVGDLYLYGDDNVFSLSLSSLETVRYYGGRWLSVTSGHHGMINDSHGM